MLRSHPQDRTSEQQTKSASTGRGEFEAPPPFTLAPLMGRDTELSLLKDRWEQAQEGMGQVLLVVGEAGLGKSRLVQTLTQRVQAQTGETPLTPAGESTTARADQDSQVIEWRCSQHFQNSELHPVSNYLEGFLEVGHDPSPTARFDRLARHLEDYDLCRPELLSSSNRRRADRQVEWVGMDGKLRSLYFRFGELAEHVRQCLLIGYLGSREWGDTIPESVSRVDATCKSL